MEINKNATEVERSFNLCGSIPFVALISSPLRMLAGQIQAVAGAVLGLAGLIGLAVSNDTEKFKQAAHLGLEHVIHGALNFIRGFGESLLATVVFGSLLLFAYQGTSSNKFEPIVKYSKDEEPVITVSVKPIEA